MTTTVADQYVIGGVDTHKDLHVAAVLDAVGRLLETKSFPTTPSGYRELFNWLLSFGVIDRIGVEGSSSWGVGLSRFLREQGVSVVEVGQPNRQTRHRKGKTDAIDAEAAARAVLSGDAKAIPKANNGHVASMRVIKIALNSALQSRTQAANQIHSIIDTAPNELREQLRSLSVTLISRKAANFRPGHDTSNVETATKISLRTLARRWLALSDEITELKELLHELVQQHAPKALVNALGVGDDVASTLMITAGDNPERCATEAGFASLCGVSPRDASSGKNQRHRLNRGGDRNANRVLRVVVLVRLRYDPATKDYMAKRIAEGKTKLEVIRCLKRAVARQLWRSLRPEIPNTSSA